TVTATNSAGTGPASSPSNAVTPAGPPGAPTNVSATAGNQTAAVSWAAPSNNGGSALTGYTVNVYPSGATQPSQQVSAGAPATSAPVSLPLHGALPIFTVTATNSAGTGPASSPSNAVTPAGPPGAPTNVSATAGNQTAAVS